MEKNTDRRKLALQTIWTALIIMAVISLYPAAEMETAFIPGDEDELLQVRYSFSSEEYLEDLRKEKLAAIVFSECVDSLCEADRDAYSSWKKKFMKLHPEYGGIYDAGSYCELSDGTQLVSFSYFLKTDHGKDGQAVVLFDGRGNVLKEPQGFRCRTIGDTGTPKFDSLAEGKLGLRCVSAGAGQSRSMNWIWTLSRTSSWGMT